MAKKKKKKRKCPHGYKYGYDSAEYEECGYCELDEKCQAKYGRLVDKGKIKLVDFRDEDENGEYYEDFLPFEDDEPKPKKKKSKTKSKKKSGKDFRFGKFRPIIISHITFKSLLSVPIKDRLGTIGLYASYLYTASWQKTNRPRATDTFISGIVREDGERLGLGIAKGRVARYRKHLEKLGLIKRIKSADGSSYIQIKYYYRKETVWDAESWHMLCVTGITFKDMVAEIADLRGLLIKALAGGKFTEQEKKWISRAKKGVPLKDFVWKPLIPDYVKKAKLSKKKS